MPRSLKILDVELGAYVTDWGTISEVKDVLLAQTQLFSGSHEISLVGGNDKFSPFFRTGLFFGRSLQNEVLRIEVDGSPLFTGVIRDVAQGAQTREAKVTAENFFAQPSETIASLTVAGANPVTAIRALLIQAGVGAYINTASFTAAAGPFQAAGATINVAHNVDTKTTILSAIQPFAS
jgi:hypothetical protein